MKKLSLVLTVLALVGLAFTNPVEVVNYKVDASQSSVKWIAKKVTGQHHGSVSVKSGNLEYTDGLLSGGQFVMDMTTIQVLDLKGNMAAKLGGHLKSADFFDVENHNEAVFSITKVVSRGTPGAYKVVGDLTVKGITAPVTLPIVQLNEEEDGVTTSEELTITIDRTAYNIKYGSGTFFGNLGDKTIYDDFDLVVSIKATK